MEFNIYFITWKQSLCSTKEIVILKFYRNRISIQLQFVKILNLRIWYISYELLQFFKNPPQNVKYKFYKNNYVLYSRKTTIHVYRRHQNDLFKEGFYFLTNLKIFSLQSVSVKNVCLPIPKLKLKVQNFWNVLFNNYS